MHLPLPTLSLAPTAHHAGEPLHPWWDLYVPATCGDLTRVRAAAARAVRQAALDRRGSVHAIAARSFLVLGQPARARRHIVAAEALGGEEADALLTFARPDGLQRVRARVRFALTAGAAADAACDGAALSVQEGDTRAALAWVLRALAACPQHAEAGRWARALREVASGHRLSVLDRHALLPVESNGWVSPERYRRRVLPEFGGGVSVTGGSSLAVLQDAGVLEQFFALPEEHALLGAEHPLTTLELCADRVRALSNEARDPVAEGWRLWERARKVDDIAAEDAGLLLVSLATVAPGLADLGWAVSDWALRHGWRDPATWHAFRARHAARSRRRSVRDDACTVLEDPAACPMAVQLAVEALAAVGELALAQERSRPHAHREELAREMDALARGAPLPARCVVTPRLVPRAAAPGH